jgi:hypothetical protein
VRGTWLVLALIVAGCGPGEPKRAHAPAPEPSPERHIETEGAQVIRRGPDRRPLWSASSASASLTYAGEGAVSGTFRKVTGRLYERGVPASTFAAQTAFADQGTSRLDMSGQVVIAALRYEARMMADLVRWRPDLELIEASGGVRVTTPDYVVGPFQALLATPDLRRFGTPDTFPRAARPDKGRDGAN